VSTICIRESDCFQTRCLDCRSRGCIHLCIAKMFLSPSYLFLLFSHQYKFPASYFSLIYNIGFKLYEKFWDPVRCWWILEIFSELKFQTNIVLSYIYTLFILFLWCNFYHTWGLRDAFFSLFELLTFLEFGKNLCLLKSGDG